MLFLLLCLFYRCARKKQDIKQSVYRTVKTISWYDRKKEEDLMKRGVKVRYLIS
jgi:hypothetical protein